MFEFALKHVQEDVFVLGNADSEKRHADKTDAVRLSKMTIFNEAKSFIGVFYTVNVIFPAVVI